MGSLAPVTTSACLDMSTDVYRSTAADVRRPCRLAMTAQKRTQTPEYPSHRSKKAHCGYELLALRSSGTGSALSDGATEATFSNLAIKKATVSPSSPPPHPNRCTSGA